MDTVAISETAASSVNAETKTSHVSATLDEPTESEVQDDVEKPAVLETHDIGAPGDVESSHGGAGSVEARNVIQLLGDADIPSCVVGVHPLRYYGAGRISRYWQVCVPTDKLDEASRLFRSEPSFEPWPTNDALPESLLHTFPRFHLKGVHFTFFLVPSDDHLIDCDPANCETSRMGILYPKLPVFAQSLLDTSDSLTLPT